jgi:hypothetical protein
MAGTLLFSLLAIIPGAEPAAAPETIWLEAEHLDGIRGYCWPMGPPKLKTTAGQAKPQQGITPTDYRENRRVVISGRVPFQSAFDRLLPDDPITVKENSLTLEVPAGGVRILELK